MIVKSDGVIFVYLCVSKINTIVDVSKILLILDNQAKGWKKNAQQKLPYRSKTDRSRTSNFQKKYARVDHKKNPEPSKKKSASKQQNIIKPLP